MTKALLTCLSHTPLKGYVDPLPAVVDEVGQILCAPLSRKVLCERDNAIVLFGTEHQATLCADSAGPRATGRARSPSNWRSAAPVVSPWTSSRRAYRRAVVAISTAGVAPGSSTTNSSPP